MHNYHLRCDADVIQALNSCFFFSLLSFWKVLTYLIFLFLPSAPVRALTVFAGPNPPELTADTLMT